MVKAAVLFVGMGLVGGVASSLTPAGREILHVGPQPDGMFIVSTGQRIVPGTLAFPQRLSDIALHPDGKTLAVVGKNRVYLCRGVATLDPAGVEIGSNCGYHGVVWDRVGKRLFVTTDKGHLQTFSYDGSTLTKGVTIDLKKPDRQNVNPQPGGMALSPDGSKLYVASAYLNCAIEVDLAQEKAVEWWPAENIPFTAKPTLDGRYLVISNWGGPIPDEDDEKALSQDQELKVDARGAVTKGSVSVIELASGSARHIEVGAHPTDIALHGDTAYVANAMADTVTAISVSRAKVTKVIDMKMGNHRIVGSMPNALALAGGKLYACNGGDNALCEIDLATGKVEGFRPAGFYPTGVQLLPDGKSAYVVNTKGNGSVRNTVQGKAGNTHDFQGTVSLVDLRAPLKEASEKVAALNQWNNPASREKPDLKVYKGAIKHVIYVVKENRTYDEVFGDMPEGNGDAKLCSLGENVMPNHRKLAKEFALFDNGFTSGTNSADGHQWVVQAMANEYLEHFYVGYSRSYPDDGQDAMALNSTDRVWDAAIKKGLSVRVYGEWTDPTKASATPRMPKDWFEAWEDRKSGKNSFKFKATTAVKGLKPLICPDYLYWPLVQSDQHRLDVFEREFRTYEATGKLPNLMVVSLPCDHGEGTNKSYPTPRAMMADNDLALGRLVDLVSHSKFWKDTCIFVTEDDSQSGPDHVDGHRTVVMALSPYTKRRSVTSEFVTQISIMKSIGTMLGFGPLAKFDSIAAPITQCFTDTPDLAPYNHVPNNIPLDEPNPGRGGTEMTAEDQYWLERTMALDWSLMDRADPYWLNRINWWSIFRGSKPYPSRPGDAPGIVIDQDD